MDWTIESLLSQTFQDWEAILVDDGSKQQDVSDAIKKAVTRDSRIRAEILPHNAGVSAARNRGLEMTRGEYLIFLDSDDLLLPWALQLMDDVIKREKEPSFLAGSPVAIYAEDSSATVEKTDLSYKIYPDYLDYRTSEENWWFNPSGAVMRADLVKAVGGFWPSRELFEDIDMWQKLGTSPRFIRVATPPTYAYRLHAGGAHHGFHALYRGLMRMMQVENSGGYPGGSARAKQRIGVIAAHARHHTLEFAKTEPILSWKIYFYSFSWNFRLRKWKFLAGFPIFFLIPTVWKGRLRQ